MIRLPIFECGFRNVGGFWLLAVLLFLYPAFALPAAPPINPNSLERLSIGGNDYVSLARWSKVAGFKGTYDARTKHFQLSTSSVRLGFTMDSRKAEFNGLTMMLSFPVVMSGSSPLISVIDFHSTLLPLVFPQKNPRLHVSTVCLDPGHGGTDTGKIAVGGAQEKRYTLLLALEVRNQLRAFGIKTVLTREKDQTLKLPERAPFAIRTGADLFISMHYNAAANRDVQGVEVYCASPAGAASSNEGGGRLSSGAYLGNIQNPQNVLLAYCLQKSILASTGIEDRGIKRSRFEVLRNARMPAVLIEGGFMTNPTDFRRINDVVFRKKMAQAIVAGILNYKRAVER